MKEKIQRAAAELNLQNIKTIYEHEHKAVYSAVSQEFGAIIIKVDSDTSRLKRECEMLQKLNGNGCCKVFLYNEADGILIEERLLPGTVLRKEKSLDLRIKAFASVFHNIHREVKNAAGDNTYLSWLEKIYQFCLENTIDDNMTAKAKTAKEICAEMFRKYPERVLLHGDLHHDNILLRSDGTWAMIDPKGVVGPKILDLPRYILNEIDTKHECPDEEHMNEVVKMISAAFGYPADEVKKVYFMETILAHVWCMEDGESLEARELEAADKIFESLG